MASPKSESEIQLEIMRFLRSQGLLFWRFSPETYNAKLGFHYKHPYIPSGLPDIMVLTDKLIGLEVKQAKGKPSANQLLMQRRFKALGHEYHIVHSVAETKAILEWG